MQKKAGKNGSFLNRFIAKWQENPLYSTGAVLIVMIIVQTIALGFSYPSFGDWFASWSKNWINILRNNAPVGIVALGMAFVIISAEVRRNAQNIRKERLYRISINCPRLMALVSRSR